MAKIKKLAVILPAEKVSPDIVITLCKAVHTGMSTNAAEYPDPPVTMANFKKAIDAAEAAIVPEGDRSTNTDAVLAQHIKILKEMLSDLSVYVLFVAKNDRFKASLSGFELNKEETTSHKPGEFSAKFVRVGPDSGTAIVRIEERAGNAFFIVQLLVDGKWVMIDAFNTLTFTVEGLPSGSSTLRIYGKKGDAKSPAVEIVVRAA